MSFKCSASDIIENHFTIFFLIVIICIVVAEVFYYLVFDLDGSILNFFDLEENGNRWWTVERKVLWCFGASFGALLGSDIVLKRWL